jgi:hypothetical protein
MADHLDLDFGVAVFSDYDEDGHLEIQHDAMGANGEGGTLPAEAILPYGLMARPLDPDKDAAGTATTGGGLLMMMHGDRRHSMPLGDPRSAGKVPKVRKGGSGLYGGNGTYYSFVLIDGVDPDGVAKSGSLTASASYDKSGSKKSHLFTMLVREPGEEAIILAHGEGHGLMVTTSGSRAALLKNATGDASIGVSDKGVTISGKTKLVGPLTVGDQGAAQPVVLAQLLITYLVALEARIATATGAGPPTMPIAAIASALGTKLLKGM